MLKSSWISSVVSHIAFPAPQIRSTILALYKLVCMYVCMFLSRLLAGQHPAARPQDSNNLNSCRYCTILRWENDRRRRTQLHCFAACRWLLLRAPNRHRCVNRYPPCRLRWLVLGRDHSARLNSTEMRWIELSQVGRCTHGCRLLRISGKVFCT